MKPRPIETAPKKTPIFIWIGWCWISASRFRSTWYENIHVLTPVPIKIKPTHWLPMPPPPHEKKSTKKKDSTKKAKSKKGKRKGGLRKGKLGVS